MLTGAGVSAGSGIPTFRDALSGLWSKHDPVMLASIEGFLKDPALVWRWYDERRQDLARKSPNAGHHALAQWQVLWNRAGRQFSLATQNIDDLHRLAGSRDVLELHGNIWWVRGVGAPHSEAVELRDCPLLDIPPTDQDGRLQRPHVVWFGEELDSAQLEAAHTAATRADMFFCIGTSALVFPAAGLAYSALRSGVRVVEVNPEPTDLSPHATDVLRGPSDVLLPQLVAELARRMPGGASGPGPRVFTE